MKHVIQDRADGGCSTSMAAISKGGEGLAVQNGQRGGWRGSFHLSNGVWDLISPPHAPLLLVYHLKSLELLPSAAAALSCGHCAQPQLSLLCEVEGMMLLALN